MREVSKNRKEKLKIRKNPTKNAKMGIKTFYKIEKKKKRKKYIKKERTQKKKPCFWKKKKNGSNLCLLNTIVAKKN